MILKVESMTLCERLLIRSQITISTQCCFVRQRAWGYVCSGFTTQLKAELRGFCLLWVIWWLCTDFASALSGHPGRVAHASSNLHRGLIINNNHILFMLTWLLIMEKCRSPFRFQSTSDISSVDSNVIDTLSHNPTLCWLGRVGVHGCRSDFRRNSFALGTPEQRNSIWLLPGGLLPVENSHPNSCQHPHKHF